jgi:hypothetical protein
MDRSAEPHNDVAESTGMIVSPFREAPFIAVYFPIFDDAIFGE